MQINFRQGVLVACGGALGALSRGVLSLQSLSFAGIDADLVVFLINIAGAFLLGWLNGFHQVRVSPHQAEISLFFGTGFLGSFTTFSSLAASTVQLGSGWGTFYIGMTLMAGLLSAALGLWLGRGFKKEG